MREPPDRDEIDAGLGDRPGGLWRHSSGGFADRPAADHGDASLEIVERHVVEQNGVGSPRERLLELGKRIDFDLDLDQMADIGADAADRLGDGAGDGRRGYP